MYHNHKRLFKITAIILSHVGVDFIPFIDLEAVDGVKIHVVTPDNKDSDYFSEPIFVNTGIPIGGEGELATKLYVSYTV